VYESWQIPYVGSVEDDIYGCHCALSGGRGNASIDALTLLCAVSTLSEISTPTRTERRQGCHHVLLTYHYRSSSGLSSSQYVSSVDGCVPTLAAAWYLNLSTPFPALSIAVYSRNDSDQLPHSATACPNHTSFWRRHLPDRFWLSVLSMNKIPRTNWTQQSTTTTAPTQPPLTDRRNIILSLSQQGCHTNSLPPRRRLGSIIHRTRPLWALNH
jgi:hypothetical protein